MKKTAAKIKPLEVAAIPKETWTPAERQAWRIVPAEKTPAPKDVWTPAERQAWHIIPTEKPSRWAEEYRTIRRGNRKGPWRYDNAPYLRGIIDIASTPGVVQVNLKKAGRMGGSEACRTLIAYWAHADPRPVGLTLPSRDKGRSVIKGDILPLFRQTPVLKNLIGSAARDVLIESIKLLNGFTLELMWAGSTISTSSNTYQVVINDEVDLFEPWSGGETDTITATEGRITTYEGRRLQFNVSTPTTTAGNIHRLYQHSTVKLTYQVPCPHCQRRQPLVWNQVKWMDLQCAKASLIAAKAARMRGGLRYAIAWNASEEAWAPADEDNAYGSPVIFATADALEKHISWLVILIEKLADVTDRRELANILATHRESAIWYECVHCRRRIFHSQKIDMVRRGRWTGPEGYVVDAWGARHEDAEDVTRWPTETRVGFAVGGLVCTWIHWGLLVSEWLGCQNDKSALFFFVTFRLGEAFEFRAKRIAETIFSAKCQRATLDEGIVPKWAWILTCTLDTQPDMFYAVVRAWGSGMRSARVWHGKLNTFDELDRLLFVKTWPVEDNAFSPMQIARALIDSGGTADRFIEISRTQQVYQYAIPRQPVVSAIKGAARPGVGIYWPMKNPMSQGGKTEISDLRALMVDSHKANDLLGELLTEGIPGRAAAEKVIKAPPSAIVGETWLLNRRDDPEYNLHMSNVQKTINPETKKEVWMPKAAGARHDYRDCEAYQVVAAYLCNVHLLPSDAETMRWKAQQAAGGIKRPKKKQAETEVGFQTGPL